MAAPQVVPRRDMGRSLTDRIDDRWASCGRSDKRSTIPEEELPMADEQQTPQDSEAAVAGGADDTGATVVGAVGADGAVQAAGGVVTDYEYAVAVAAFADDSAAMSAYQALQDAETAGQLSIDGVLVIKTDEGGKVKIQKMTDHSTKTGVKWGAVGGVVLGIFFPPSILAAAVGTGAVGGVLGKLRNEVHKSAVGDALAGALGPNESGLLVVAKASDIDGVKQAMPQATKLRTVGVDGATATDISKAAQDAS
jgi:uncharacterized membrane protein